MAATRSSWPGRASYDSTASALSAHVTSARTPVANRDLWEPLVTLVGERGDVAFRWIKGHSGDAMNDLVDPLAVAACFPDDSSAPRPGG